MKALHRMDRYRKEVLQLSTRKHGINVQYLYDISPIEIEQYPERGKRITLTKLVAFSYF